MVAPGAGALLFAQRKLACWAEIDVLIFATAAINDDFDTGMVFQPLG